MLFIEYPKCSTCKRARKFLDDNKVDYEGRDIVEDRPRKNELDKWIKLSGLDIHNFFNTSGIKYRELNLKDVLKELSYEEKLEILSSDGMLVKRPLLILDDGVVLVGFNEDKWRKVI